MRRHLLLLLLVPAIVGTVIGVAAAAWRVSDGPRRQSDVAEAVVAPPVVIAPQTSTVPAPSTLPPVTEATPEPATVPTTVPTPAAPTYDVAAVQVRLTELAYYVGAVDGNEGPATRSAVMAFQKVNGLSADGTVGPATLAALATPVAPVLNGGPPTRIEVDLTKQVLYFVTDGALARIMPVSSGSGDTYRTSGGGRARSLTPAGTFTIERRIRGIREADLGTLYDPMYFYKGWALHGSNSVPAYPASHGCVRLTRPDALWLFDRAPNGTTVILYGGQFTFAAGSSAPGTDTPAGDTAAPAAPAPVPDTPSTPPQTPPSATPPSASVPSETPSTPTTAAPTQAPTDAPTEQPTPASTDAASPPVAEPEPGVPALPPPS